MNLIKGLCNISLGVVIALFVWVTPIYAQTLSDCASGEVRATWDANSELDLAGYNLTISEDGVPRPVVPFPNTAVSSPCEVIGAFEYLYALTAFDTSGNESSPTLFNLDKKPPSTPTGFTVTTIITTIITIP